MFSPCIIFWFEVGSFPEPFAATVLLFADQAFSAKYRKWMKMVQSTASLSSKPLKRHAFDTGFAEDLWPITSATRLLVVKHSALAMTFVIAAIAGSTSQM